jgi:hypothetical protein
MKIVIHEINSIKVAEIVSDEILIKETQDALDILADAFTREAFGIIIREQNIIPQFFDLKTLLAGDILQKFSTYNFKLALIGDFSKYKSKSFRDFIYESNRGNRVFFVENLDEALLRLSGK